MNVLSVNHGAKGIMLWTFPTTNQLAAANGKQAVVFTNQPVLGFLTGGQPAAIKVQGHQLLDVAYWIVGSQAMIGVANLDYANGGTVTVHLPFSVTGLGMQPWGSLGWSLVGSDTLVIKSLPALATSMLILYL